jgi:hypothetical protein
MKLKSIALFSLVILFSSCGLNDLEDRLNKVEDDLGTSSPLILSVTTKDYDNANVSFTQNFAIKAERNYSYLGKNPDGTIEVYVYRLLDTNWSEYAGFGFVYDPSTKAIVENSWWIETDLYTKEWNSLEFYADWDYSNITLDGITVKSLNSSNGSVDVTVNITTSDAFSYNLFEGKGMKMTFRFKGDLPVFENGN